MDETEKRALQLLYALEPGSWCYEPDGNCPPDFALNGKVAVEVTRLNKAIEIDRKQINLDSDIRSICDSFTGQLKRFDSKNNTTTWFVRFSLKRPIDWRQVRTDLRQFLKQVFHEENIPAEPVRISSGFCLHFYQASFEPDIRYRFAGYLDRNNTGWVIPTLADNIRRISSRKFDLTQPFRDTYSSWWLVLENHISFSLAGPIELNELLDALPIIRGWHRILIFDPRHPTKFAEIPSRES
ncbi:hypothetical protein ACFMPD_07590 [Sedimentitalea sp. HM32M-2]|uniref:hypothetical protein n=1 Tax=Sedimentitalea sp. HM32M-2 TaxID=3351566 RepID=UPI00362F7013